ncbi:hypothetical protein RHGRI_010971 [Rhododendron griersonianum]|uniref:Uncharacterized protein n=1 Tax=Rhododendron griersonianum TaxID=479676 RepID=A0AAV6KL52_9ERIC|nr:hypothetical protein RHGRI_010971 [Rhododendron griersonianum]
MASYIWNNHWSEICFTGGTAMGGLSSATTSHGICPHPAEWDGTDGDLVKDNYGEARAGGPTSSLAGRPSQPSTGHQGQPRLASSHQPGQASQAGQLCPC